MAWGLKNIAAAARAGSTHTTPLGVAYPTSVAAGDIFICGLVHTIAAETFTFSDTDFQSIVIRTGNASISLWWKVANGTESGNFTVQSSDDSGGLYAQAVSFTGGPVAANSGNVAASATFGGSAATGLSFPSLTIAANNCLVIVLGGKNCGANTFSVPGAFTAELGEAHFSTSECMVWDYVIQTTATNITGTTWTIGSGDASATRVSVIAALLPGTGAPNALLGWPKQTFVTETLIQV